ncbi:NADP oxidoreductase [Chitinilyticum litopenaei]|uniref:NADH-quinone oxidoreductase subunit B family protein n=1 Tax=Chitinilyticum litopenaei TaxID=1121276 RepID=UPI00041630F6|nr:NADP oxidoreductase [Chitinilyticum litopenaei]
MNKIRVATCSLAGCFGCHMSFLDIDERIAELAELVDFDRSPLTDIKEVDAAGIDIGLVEGGVCNAENVHTLREFRSRCRILIAVGACALSGGVPALRNRIPLEECFAEAYLQGPGIEAPQVPDDPELPLLLDRVYPLHEVVRIDRVLPGCPPPADAFWELLTALLAGREPELAYPLRRFD